MNIVATVYRRTNSAEAFLLDRAKKIAGVALSVQSGFCHGRRVEAALESDTRFHRRVIKRAHDEVFAAVSLRTPGEFFVFVSETLNYLRPGNVRARLSEDRQRNYNAEN